MSSAEFSVALSEIGWTRARFARTAGLTEEGVRRRLINKSAVPPLWGEFVKAISDRSYQPTDRVPGKPGPKSKDRSKA